MSKSDLDLSRRSSPRARPRFLDPSEWRAAQEAQRAAERAANQVSGERIARRREQILRRHLDEARVWWSQVAAVDARRARGGR